MMIDDAHVELSYAECESSFLRDHEFDRYARFRSTLDLTSKISSILAIRLFFDYDRRWMNIQVNQPHPKPNNSFRDVTEVRRPFLDFYLYVFYIYVCSIASHLLKIINESSRGFNMHVHNVGPHRPIPATLAEQNIFIVRKLLCAKFKYN
jgi:hypothetical protein